MVSFSSEKASKPSNISWGWQPKMFKICWTLFYTAWTLLKEYISEFGIWDGCMFCITSVVSKQNIRIWGAERTDEHESLVMNSAGAINRCVISSERGLGPCFSRTRKLRVRVTEIYLFNMSSFASSCSNETEIKSGLCSSRLLNPHKGNLKWKRPSTWRARDAPAAWSALSTGLTLAIPFLAGSSSPIYILHARLLGGATPANWVEICRTSQDILTTRQDNTKLRLNYIMNVDGE